MAQGVTVPRRHVINKVDSKYQIIPYDADNLYPQRIANIIASSGAASICARWFAKFIKGQGFEDINFSKMKVNRKGETADVILKKITEYYAKFGSFALHFNYNLLGEKTEMQIVPFSYVRMESEKDEVRFTGKFKVYNNWDLQKKRTVEANKIQVINEYAPNKVLSEIEQVGIAAYNGQLFYLFSEYGSYPISPIDAEAESAVVDSEIKEFNYSNVTTGFLGAHIAEYPFKFENDDARTSEVDNLNNLQGAREATKIMMIENEYADTKPFRLHEVKATNVDTMFLNTEKTTRERIRKMYEVPPAFLDAVAGSLGADDIRNAYDFYNAVTQDYRIEIEELMREMFTGWAMPMNESGNFKIKPLTYEQDVEGKTETGQEVENFAATALNGAQVTSLVEIVNAKNLGTLSEEAAIQLIISAFPSINLQTAEKIVGKINVNNIQ
jgi:hypothetical protein